MQVSYIIPPMGIHLTPITQSQVTPEILAFFDITKPTMPRAFHALEGLNRGEILVDDPINPTTAVVRDGMYGTLYFGGKMTAGLLSSLVHHFREVGDGALAAGYNLVPRDEHLFPNPLTTRQAWIYLEQ